MMKRFLLPAFLLIGSITAAIAASTINPTVPAQNAPLSSAPIRNNFQAATNDINNLLTIFQGSSSPLTPSIYQRWMDTSGSPTNALRIWDGSQWVSMGTLNTTTHVWQSQLLSLSSGQLIIGQSSGSAAETVSGDITIANTGITTIGANVVTNAKSAQMATLTTKCNSTGGTANASDCSVSTMKTMLGLVRSTYSSNTALSPTATTSSTAVMMGMGSSIALTPSGSGNVVIYITGYVTDNGAGNNVGIIGYYGTSTAPSNGAALTGTAINNAPILATAGVTGSPDIPFTFVARVTGLTISTAYWFDLAMSASAGTATMKVTDITVKEE